MILKPVTGTGFNPDKPVTGTGFKNRSGTPENRSQGPMNHYKNQEVGGNAPARMGARDPQAGTAPPPEQAGAGAASNINEAGTAPGFAAFAQAYPKKTGMGAAQPAFTEACTIADPDYIVARAKLYAKDFEGERARFAIPPKQWLEDRCFNDPLPDGVTIDNDTGEFVPPTNKPKPNGKISGSQAGAELIRRLGDVYKFDLH